MTPLQRRFTGVIERLGDSIEVGVTRLKALTAPLSNDEAKTYLNSLELSSAALPVRVFYVPFDDSTPASASLAWNGSTMTVRRVVELRFQDTAVLRMLVAT